MERSTISFIVAGLLFIAYFVVESIGFATAENEGQLAARATVGNSIWILAAAIIFVVIGIWLKYFVR